MIVAVSFAQFAHHVVAVSFIDARCESSECLVTKRCGVHEWSDERTRAFRPVIVSAVPVSAPRNVDEAASGENRTIPLQ